MEVEIWGPYYTVLENAEKTAAVYTKRKKTYSWYAKTKFSKHGTLLNLKFVLGTILNFFWDHIDRFRDVEFFGDQTEQSPLKFGWPGYIPTGRNPEFQDTRI